MGDAAAGPGQVADPGQQPAGRRLVGADMLQQGGQVFGRQLLDARVAGGDEAEALQGGRAALVAGDLAEQVPLAHPQRPCPRVCPGRVLVQAVGAALPEHFLHQAVEAGRGKARRRACGHDPGDQPADPQRPGAVAEVSGLESRVLTGVGEDQQPAQHLVIALRGQPCMQAERDRGDRRSRAGGELLDRARVAPVAADRAPGQRLPGKRLGDGDLPGLPAARRARHIGRRGAAAGAAARRVPAPAARARCLKGLAVQGAGHVARDRAARAGLLQVPVLPAAQAHAQRVRRRRAAPVVRAGRRPVRQQVPGLPAAAGQVRQAPQEQVDLRLQHRRPLGRVRARPQEQPAGDLVPQRARADPGALRQPREHPCQLVDGARRGQLGAEQVQHRAGLRVAEDVPQRARVGPGGQHRAQRYRVRRGPDQRRVRGRGLDRGLLYDRLRAERGSEQVRGERRSALQVSLVVTARADRGRQAHAHQPVVIDVAAQTADQAGDLAAQRPLVGVDLVQHQVPQHPVAEQLPVLPPGHDELQHRVVRQQDVRRVLLHPVPLMRRRCSRVHPVTQPQRLARRLDAVLLVVDQGIHRVQRDRLDARPVPLLERVRRHRDQERLGLPRPGARRHQRPLPGRDPGDRRHLVGEQPVHLRERRGDLGRQPDPRCQDRQ